MGRHGAGLFGLTAALSVTALGLFPVVAHAATATNFRYEPTTISVTGHRSLHVQHVVAKDPWSGVETTQIHLVAGAPPSEDIPRFVVKDPASGIDTVYMPIYYLDNILNHYWRMGATWNGVNHTWSFHFQPIW